MLKHRHILAYFLSALISLQALAAVAVPCSQSAETAANKMVTEGAAQHYAHHGASNQDDASDEANTSCCDTGYCSQGGCYSIAAAANDDLPPLARRMHSPPAVDLTSAPLHAPDPLFRPPSS